jgi:hypothetical protein
VEERQQLQGVIKDAIKVTHGKNLTDDEVHKLAVKKEQKLVKYSEGGIIFGKSQVTGTEGHKESIDVLKEHFGKDLDANMIAGDLSVGRTLGVKLDVNIRPDLTVIKKDGSVIMIEVQSGSQTRKELEDKLGGARKQLIEKHGYSPSKIKTEVYKPEQVFKKFGK